MTSFKETHYKLLPRQKSFRCRNGRKNKTSKSSIAKRVSVHERPPDVNAREDVGNFESDLMQFSTYGQLLVIHERKSRFTIFIWQETKTADDVADNLVSFFNDVPQEIRRFLPRKTDPAEITPERLAKLNELINNTPRKCLGYLTPNEVFFNKITSVALQT